MCRYIYAYSIDHSEDGLFLDVPKFPLIVSELEDGMTDDAIRQWAADRILANLQSAVTYGGDIPDGDDEEKLDAHGFVHLNPTQSMKLQIARLVQENDQEEPSMARRLAKRLGKTETVARRLLNLSHNSTIPEMEAAVAAYNRRLIHDWSFERLNAA